MRNVYGSLVLLLASGLAEAQSLTVKKDQIQISGQACKNMSVDHVSFEANRLVVDLKAMVPANAVTPRLTCLIRIPYTEAKGSSPITLAGNYELGGDERLTLAVRADTQGGIAPAKIIDIEASPKGQISYQDSLKFDAPSRATEGWIRLSLTAQWKAMTASNKEQSSSASAESRGFQFQRITLGDVKDGSLTSE